MFFPKLRRHAKWMFLFLALVFGLGFVGFGVGAGGIGVGNIFEGVGESGVPSVSEAEKRVSENPQDPTAFRDLATAHQTEGNTDEAIEALENLVRLRPKNVDALSQLAALYLTKSSEAQDAANRANTRAAFIAPGAAVANSLLLDGKPLDPDPISSAVNGKLSESVNLHLGEAQQAAAQAVDAYRRITLATPRDPASRLILAETAIEAGDAATAIAAYEKFLELAPNDPQVADVKRVLKELRAQSGATG